MKNEWKTRVINSNCRRRSLNLNHKNRRHFMFTPYPLLFIFFLQIVFRFFSFLLSYSFFIVFLFLSIILPLRKTISTVKIKKKMPYNQSKINSGKLMKINFLPYFHWMIPFFMLRKLIKKKYVCGGEEGEMFKIFLKNMRRFFFIWIIFFTREILMGSDI